MMNQFFQIYMAIWISACILAIIIVSRNRHRYELLRKPYLRFISKPWKIITFLVATIGMTIAAPYSGDPTWDYFDSIAMSVMTFLTAPWAIGVLYRSARGKLPVSQAYVALCLIMFVSSWFYDAYILLRDGYYPLTWLHNIPLSSSMYIAAGLLWNLEWREKKGVDFAFRWEDWLEGNGKADFSKVVWVALLFMLFGSFVVGLFVWDEMLGNL